MQVINVEHLKYRDRVVEFPCGMVSNRILLDSDNMGFTLTKTVIPRGDWRCWQYKNHLEACYCISGKGIIHDLITDVQEYVFPGITYVLDKHENHRLRVLQDMVLICVFNPALIGKEIHDAEGSYEGSICQN